MLVVRLKRIGKKNKPTYRVVVAEHSNAVNGPFVVDLGFYNPHSKQFSIDKDAVTDWMNKGAKPSNRVARLLEKEKIKHKSVVVIKYQKASKKKAEGAKKVVKPEAAEEATETPAGETAEATETVDSPEAPTKVTEEEPATEEAAEVAEDSSKPEEPVA